MFAQIKKAVRVARDGVNRIAAAGVVMVCASIVRRMQETPVAGAMGSQGHKCHEELGNASLAQAQ